MATGKRDRDSMVKPVTPGYRIEDESRKTFKAMADAVGAASSSHLLDLLASYIETDPATGRPVWWPEDDDREELPIDPT
ncbi:hypothetical protein KN200_15805 (plasmid) [Clavibacter michiganensis subsp. michiganensis]|uniref:Uncharacterized protein n=1 Tax=Clavibacter michiganensis subsp. michiganensis (strain NCPPB 382) TaxID=443906 RepID=A5CLL0_CLAM3|nr:hypothetical protein [Clavibacter michiganensis]MDO4101242.1 hypothetical protein [Clavibacter michiganensis]MDO4129128.1 hypothetical protein [Clavibacter michiganensis]QXP07564.1 hypothetical protein KN200_15805 [Clavibacter michiganensis subsp. michiganensis]CAM98480.1 hypothetical protein pCM1_0027 [Clavibacter michiganensis subsp. michiganensis NCPPB 382]